MVVLINQQKNLLDEKYNTNNKNIQISTFTFFLILPRSLHSSLLWFLSCSTGGGVLGLVKHNFNTLKFHTNNKVNKPSMRMCSAWINYQISSFKSSNAQDKRLHIHHQLSDQNEGYKNKEIEPSIRMQ